VSLACLRAWWGARFHELVGEILGELTGGRAGKDAGSDGEPAPDPAQVRIGIEIDRGPWVTALVAAGYTVYAANPKQVTRYRDRVRSSGAKSDAGDAHALADMVRTDAHQLRPVAGDRPQTEGLKAAARAHQTLIWDRHRQALRLRSALRDYFPAALETFEDLSAPHTLELLALAPEPELARKLARSRIVTVLRRTGRRNIEEKATRIQAGLRSPQLAQPAALVVGYAAVTRAAVGVLQALNTEIAALAEHLDTAFDQHPEAAIYRSQPGVGAVLGARVLGEFGDDPARYADARARKNYAATSPLTRASGKKTTITARYVGNHRLLDALHQQAFCATNTSPGAKAYYDELRARGTGHHAALRQLSNRLVGILHGCLKNRTLYDEATAWAHRAAQPPAAA
jgi:transposase/transposase IS116/IS110/IS902 family protein